MTTTTDPGILSRKVIGWAPRATLFATRGDFNIRHQLPPLAPWLEQAAAKGYRQIMCTGGWDAAHTPEREWWVDGPAAAGWSVESYVPDPRYAVYVRRDEAGGRHKITVRMSASWYDDCDQTVLIREAHTTLARLLKASFDTRAVLMGTPARTGQDLLQRSLPEGVQYLSAPLEVRELLNTEYYSKDGHRHLLFPQGRMEFVAPPDAPPVSDLYLLDARWMYAAHIRNSSSGSMPVLTAPGQLIHDDTPDFEPYRAGFYRVAFRPPDDWHHIGLLPVWDGNRTIWPANDDLFRGQVMEETGWAIEPELRLALAHGWRVHILERLLFAPQGTPGGDPCRAWAEKLIALRARLDASEGDVPRLLSAAVRHLLIDTVGSWRRSDRRELHATLPGHEDDIPEDAEEFTPIYEHGVHVRSEWYGRAPLDPMQQAMYRPEWAAMVWGRSRAALNEFAVRYFPDELVALRSDAVAARNLNVTTADDGKPGRFRLRREWHFDPPRPCPHDETAWRALVGGDE